MAAAADRTGKLQKVLAAAGIARRRAHRSSGGEKESRGRGGGDPPASALRKLRPGIDLGDGEPPTAPAKVTPVDPNVLRIPIHEGRNRQIRRMCEAVGHPVVRLVRTRIGPIAERRLKPGEWRVLTTAEVRAPEPAT